MRRLNRKGAEMTIGTLVIIVLAIIVLVVIALGFGMGWSSLWGKIKGYFSPVNVDSVKQACQYAVTTDSRFDYCCVIRDVKFEEEGDTLKLKCTDSRLAAKNPAPLFSCGDVQCGVSGFTKDIKEEYIDADLTKAVAAAQAACKKAYGSAGGNLTAQLINQNEFNNAKKEICGVSIKLKYKDSADNSKDKTITTSCKLLFQKDGVQTGSPNADLSIKVGTDTVNGITLCAS